MKSNKQRRGEIQRRRRKRAEIKAARSSHDRRLVDFTVEETAPCNPN